MNARIVKRRKIPKLINFDPGTVEFLKGEQSRLGGRPMNIIIEDLVLGRGRFAPDIERWIAAKSYAMNLPRDLFIERILLDEMRRATDPRQPVTSAEA